jgi:integrase
MTVAVEIASTSLTGKAPGSFELSSRIDPAFLSLLSWDPQVRMLVFPSDHPVLGWRRCPVQECGKPATVRDSPLCNGCRHRFDHSGRPLEEFLATTRGPWSGVGIGACAVSDCRRPWRTSATSLCIAHHAQRKRLRLPLEDFLVHPTVTPLASHGLCQVAACDRDRSGPLGYCSTHAVQVRRHRRRVQDFDEDRWARTTSAIVQSGTASLRGLPDQVVAELIYGLQERTKDGAQTRDFEVRKIADLARERELTTLEDLSTDCLTRHYRSLLAKVHRSVLLLRLTTETERLKDVWEAAVFGHAGTLRFTDISQRWLREATKRWAYDELPKRRGDAVTRGIQAIINSVALLSESLRLQRDDHGNDLTALGRDDITAFCNRMAYLSDSNRISARTRLYACRNTRRVLSRVRTLGLTRRGELLHRLPDTFAVNAGDIPDHPEDTEAGKDLPAEVMQVLCANLDTIDIGTVRTEMRVAVELIIDTGRRPNEIAQLPLDCLERDGDSKPVLVYDNRKNLRNGRKLPVSEATAATIVAQQERVRAQFPHTPTADLKLLPRRVANPDGTKAITVAGITERHRSWVADLPPIHVPVTVQENGTSVVKMLPFDKAKIFPYAYRHTYAQRHADAGVRADVLQKLMDHRLLSTTQKYYRVGEERRREAVERVVTMQFDRHGNRIWRQTQTVLDSEHARRSVGEVAIPYGGCTEPSNVAAGGHSCPFRFRCVGCGHFRTDVSYLPDLETYLADLLRSRERLLSTVEVDDWARAEAMPSDEEIKRVRRLISRMKADIEDLSHEEKTRIMEDVSIVRRHRQGVVDLGMPAIRQPQPDVHPGQVA